MDFLLSILSNIWTFGGSFLLVLGILVFIHELGHYSIAKLFGVKVETFSIGFGPEIFGFNDTSGTRWKVSVIPLGGFVKMFGDSDPASSKNSDSIEETGKSRKMTEKERNQAFFAKPVWQRFLIVLAGPAINFILAIILLAGLYGFMGKPITPATYVAIDIEGAAYKAGLRPGDTVTAINGRPVKEFQDVTRQLMLTLDQPVDFTVRRDDSLQNFTVKPDLKVTEDRFGFENKRGRIGVYGGAYAIKLDTITEVNGQAIEPSNRINHIEKNFGKETIITISENELEQKLLLVPNPNLNSDIRDNDKTPNILVLSQSSAYQFMSYSPVTATGAAILETFRITRDTLKALGQIITGSRGADDLGGIIRIGAIAGDMAQKGVVALITFTALLSINLGLINLFPVPMLDGGHLVFYIIEAIKGSPVSETIQDYAFRFGFAFLIGVMVFTNVNDVVQIFF